ncbi:MAG: ABC transporter substrate-binding protein [Verrucomicrobia bacterium]|nr:ABC transporter substrate-binding protein [Verrucomicrobiota bacterium]
MNQFPSTQCRDTRTKAHRDTAAIVVPHGLAAAMVWLMSTLWPNLDAAQPPPYMRLRDSTLEYPGPSANITNSTEYKIGWFGPTNLDDPLTGDLWWAARFAIDKANSEISKPVPQGNAESSSLPFRLVPRWATNPWGTGVSLLARMVYEEHPIALLGSVDSASTHLAEQVVAKAQLPLVSPIATDKSVTLAGVSWTFACAPSDDAIARVLVDHVFRALQSSTSNRTEHKTARSIVMLSCTDHESRMTAREVMKQFSLRGRLPDYRLELPPGMESYLERIAPLEQSLGQSGHIILLIVAAPEDSARLLQAARECLCHDTSALRRAIPNPKKSCSETAEDDGELRCLIFGTHAMARARFLALAGTHAEGVHVPILFVPDPENPATAGFIREFTMARGHAPDHAAALTYDATRLLIAAIQSGGPNRARVREALAKLSPWQGVAGTIQFDGTGQNTRTNVAMGIVRNGAIVRLTPPDPK